jgi:hypothetical protein
MLVSRPDDQECESVASQASEDVRRTRGRVATLKGRLSSLLSNQPGEVTEQVWLQAHSTAQATPDRRREPSFAAGRPVRPAQML